MNTTEWADSINAAVAAGRKVTVAGREVVTTGTGQPTIVWGTGSVSVKVRSKTKRSGFADLWILCGAPLPAVTIA